MLKSFFRPRAVAVVGASTQPGKVGYDVLLNLTKYGFKGQVYPINPKADTILGKPCFKSVADLPDDVDLAVIAVPAQGVPGVVRELGAKHIPSCVVITAGFKEVGGEGARLEAELKRALKETNIRAIGPNCVGVMDTVTGLNASFAADMPNRGEIGFFSQSGAMCLAILDWSLDNKIGFSKFISLGNKTDLSETEILEMLAEDKDTKVIMGYLEAVEDGPRFMEVASRVTRIKPIVLLKSGVTSAGAKAASSHTGALAGADAAYEAAFKQCGVLRVHSVRDLFNLAQALARQPLPEGPALAVVTNSGGPGIIAADSAELCGLHMAGLRPETVDELRSFLPPIASVYNPIDIAGGAKPELYERSLEVTLADPNVNGVAVILTPTAMVNPPEMARRICRVKSTKPVFAVLMGRHTVEESRLYCMEQGMPAYDFPEDAVDAMRGMLDYRHWLDSKPHEPMLVKGDRERVAAIIAKLRKQGRLQMSESEAQGASPPTASGWPARSGRTSEERWPPRRGWLSGGHEDRQPRHQPQVGRGRRQGGPQEPRGGGGRLLRHDRQGAAPDAQRLGARRADPGDGARGTRNHRGPLPGSPVRPPAHVRPGRHLRRGAQGRGLPGHADQPGRRQRDDQQHPFVPAPEGRARRPARRPGGPGPGPGGVEHPGARLPGAGRG